MPIQKSYITALAARSSYVENILTHRMVADLASELWHRNPSKPFQILNSEVDDSGIDLILGCESALRYIQVKQVHSGGKAKKFSIRLSFSRLPGSCVVLIKHDSQTLNIENYLFYGGGPNESMPSLAEAKVSKSPVRRDTATGKRTERPNYRDVPISKFKVMDSPGALLSSLFPETENQGGGR